MTQRFSFTSFALGIGLGILLSAAWFFGGPLTMADLASQTTATSTVAEQQSEDASGAVSVANQPAGDSVTVSSLTVPPPGVWVAIREVSASDLGNVLGAERVGGPRTDIVVPLLRATQPGQTYAVELYRDNGDGAFDLATDSVYVDFDTGSRVVEYFTTTN